jgi:3-oxoadipate enol-lactonase
VAIAYPERVKRLMLVDTAAGFPEEGKVPLRAIRAKVLENGITAILDAAMGRMFPASYIAAAPDVIAERRAALSKADAALFANACGALIALDHRPSLHKVHHETLVMVGLEDQTTPPALSRELASMIPQSKLLELPGLGHCPQIQDPAAFVTAVRAFLA